MADLALVRGLEERCFNSWPALKTVLVEGWVVRLSDGHTKRANSASALSPSPSEPEALIAAIEPLFRDAGLPPLFRLSPLADPAFDRALAARGYRAFEPSLGMIAHDLGAARKDPAVRFTPQACDRWLADAMAAYGHGAKGERALRAMFANLTLPAGFATVSDGEGDVAWGLAVVERGMVGLHDLVAAPQARGRGLGARLVQACCHWGAARGATAAYLQVREENTGAIRLYERLGFASAYRYTHRVAP
jgi:N-acetylglutamate synthase